MTLTDLEYQRAKLLAQNPALARIVCTVPLVRRFDDVTLPGRELTPEVQAELAAKLWRLQALYHELRVRFITTKRLADAQRLARVLPRLDARLSRYCTGWIL